MLPRDDAELKFVPPIFNLELLEAAPPPLPPLVPSAESCLPLVPPPAAVAPNAVEFIPAPPVEVVETPPAPTKKSKVQFTDNKWASILNETDALIEQQPSAMNSLAELMNEGMDDIHMTSNDAQGFGMMRQNMNNSITSAAPKVMEDPETGKLLEVAPEVAKAMTRDYSQLMKAINNKKGIS